MIAGMVECGVCRGSGAEPGDPFRICGHCVGAGQLTASGRTSRTVLQAMDYAAGMLGGNGYDIVMEARAAVAELIEEAKRAERLLRDMAEAGLGDPKQADKLRATLSHIGPQS